MRELVWLLLDERQPEDPAVLEVVADSVPSRRPEVKASRLLVHCHESSSEKTSEP